VSRVVETFAFGWLGQLSAVLVIPPWSFESELFSNPVLNLGERNIGIGKRHGHSRPSKDVMEYGAQSGAAGYQR
jgi:hypothetical protein